MARPPVSALLGGKPGSSIMKRSSGGRTTLGTLEDGGANENEATSSIEARHSQRGFHPDRVARGRGNYRRSRCAAVARSPESPGKRPPLRVSEKNKKK